MKKNFTLSLLLAVTFSAFTFSSQAQCPTTNGMTGTSLRFNGNCYFFVQFAIPNSNVSIYNASGYVGEAIANNQGSVLLPFNCAAAPITAILSFGPGGVCTNYNISAAITLPIKLSSFTANIAGNGVLLEWETSFELNNEKYVIEKSTDGKNYLSIGTVAGAINSLEKNNYSFTDANYVDGEEAFYRLRQVDIDGRSSLSKVAYVNNSDSRTKAVRIAPNPFSSEIQLIGIKATSVNRNSIRLHNIAGAAVDFEISGSNSIRVSPSAPSGMYFLTIDGTPYKIMKN